MKKLSTEEAIKRFREKHGTKYNYSKVKYINNDSIIIIICPIHGEFNQIAGEHIRGRGCKICSDDRKRSNKESFTEQANKIHNHKFDYSKVVYKQNKEKVIIGCSVHGDFLQKPNHHLSGEGCPKCKQSKGERIIESYLKNNNIDFIPQKLFFGCKNLRHLPFDFYLPSYNTCIEYDGMQHFYPTGFGSTRITKEHLQTLKQRDKIKTNYCFKNKIKLIRIKYTKIKNIEEILTKELLSVKKS